MKKAGKIIIYAVIALVIVVGGLLSYVKFGLPNVGKAPELKVELTPQRIARGKYLANNVTVCIDCHSTRDWSKLAGPLDSTGIGIGGEKFDDNVGFPGEVEVPNITPFNLKNWTDGELFRAITCGVKKDGSAIFPIMPYTSYSKMDKEDIYSIIAYIRTLPSKVSKPNERKLDFPLNFLVNTMPVKTASQPVPAVSDQLAYGAYLVNSAACRDCHTQEEKGKFIEGMDFAGGRPFKIPGATISSANITPDVESGIGKWTKEAFIARFKAFEKSHELPKVKQGEFQTIMPWNMYAGMKTTDLEAIFAYLKTLKPVKNQVTKFAPLVAANQ
ncbi:c-type cytochrome [Desertivirga arenae]|uniref:c-type cytochrome n=1 Tax=Desertivirga arenae TaxID=2810309 RepID=UPI001A97AAF1|nr:c-type cytochrome [Pedobacter sp. SYSU D00823]